MFLPQFKYLSPATTDELAALLGKHRQKAKILSGGTDLLVQMKDKLLKPEYLIDISSLEALQGIAYGKGKGLVIGAATKLHDVERSRVIKEKYYALYQAATAVGSPQVRAMGTIGGNSCTASPAADTPPSLIAFGAKVNLVSQRGRRQIPLEEFIRDYRLTDLKEDEFLESFVLEEPWRNSASCYLYKGLRAAMEIDMVNIAVNLGLDFGTRKVKDVRIVMGSVAPTPLRARKAENLLVGQVPDNALLNRAAEVCARESRPIDDFRATAPYRREMVKVFVRRALKEVLTAVG